MASLCFWRTTVSGRSPVDVANTVLSSLSSLTKIVSCTCSEPPDSSPMCADIPQITPYAPYAEPAPKKRVVSGLRARMRRDV